MNLYKSAPNKKIKLSNDRSAPNYHGKSILIPYHVFKFAKGFLGVETSALIFIFGGKGGLLQPHNLRV